VPKRAPAFLEAEEVPRLLAQLSHLDRNLAATALYAGLRLAADPRAHERTT
jgi:hypothetical protein